MFGTATAAPQNLPVAVDRPIMVSPTATVFTSPAQAASPPESVMAPALVATALYAVAAAILLFITLLALPRLIALRARAEVLVDGHWLSALARAQRRMGFKHGTALLTSDDLSSPISWGLMRPVILLNSKAVEASGEAEAIIAHELAHVARMDWAKLLDPIWGRERNFSDYYPDWSWDIDIRRDAGKFAYGFAISDRDRFFNFRTDQIDGYPNIGPYATAFIEYRPSARSSLNLYVENLIDTAGAVDRFFYFPNRTNPDPVLHEYRFRNSHPRVQLT